MSVQSGDHIYFWTRKLGSAVPILLIVSFYALYILPMSKASEGPEGFDGLMLVIGTLPAIGLAEGLLILLPLVLHTVLAAIGGYSSSINVFSYPNYRNWIYLAKRVSGFVVIFFVLYHLFVNRISYIFARGGFDYARLASDFASRKVDVIYFAGLACMSFYLGASISALFFEWGIATSKKSTKMLDILTWVVAFVFMVWGIGAMRAFI